MAIHRRGGKGVTVDRINTQQQAGHRAIEPLESRLLFSQPPLTVQPPAAIVVSAPDVTSAGGTSIAITVQYTDSTAFNFTTFNDNNIYVTQPGGGTLTPVSETLNSGGTDEFPQITYTFAAPNGAWADSNDGVYGIYTASGADAAADQSGNSPTAGQIGHFKVFTSGAQAGFSGGAVTGNFTTNDLIQQSDGAYVATGEATIAGSTTALVVQRYGGSGGADYTFGADGEDEIQFGAGSAGYGIVEQGDGQLDVAGTTTDPGTGATDFTVFRVGGSGYPDPSFGQDLNGDGTPDGLETIDVGGTNPAAYGITQQEDGEIVAVGTTDDIGTGDFVVALLQSSGQLDAGFGTGGYTTTSFGSAASAGAVAIQPSTNDIIVAGNAGNNVVVAAYTPEGVLDTNFGTGGTVTVPGMSTSNFHVGLAVQTNGDILVGATDSGNGEMAVTRLGATGSVDTSFGTGGIAAISAGGATGQVNSILLQTGNQIAIGGIATSSGATKSYVATLGDNGQAENNFSGNDYSGFNSGTQSNEVASIAPATGGVVFDTSNNVAGTSSLSELSTDSTPPTASLTATSVTTPSATATFTVTYSDNVAIDPTTFGTGNVTVSNGSQSLSVTSFSASSNSPGSPITVTYTVAAPGGGTFSSADNGTYTVALAAQVKNTAGVAVAANSDLGSLTVDEPGSPAPQPSLTASDLTTNNSTSYSFTVTYTDALGINVATVAPSNVTVTSPTGAALTVSSAVVDTDSNGSPRTVTYTVAAPQQVFSSADNGTYTIGVSNTLQDVNGNATVANSNLGTFAINVTNSPQTLLGSFGTVAGSKKSQKLSVSINGVPTTFSITNGSGQAYLNGNNVDLTVTVTSGKKAAIAVTPKGGRITLGDVTITGTVSTFTAPAADLAGTFYIDGAAGTVTLGNLTNATFDAAFTMGTFKAISLTNSDLLDGVQEPGTYGAGVINTVTIAGSINDSVVAAGANPVNGVFGDGDDTLAAGGSSIKTITAKGGTTGNTVFESGSIKSASLPKKIKTLSTDSRFKILS